jgi:hypothetical protein
VDDAAEKHVGGRPGCKTRADRTDGSRVHRSSN